MFYTTSSQKYTAISLQNTIESFHKNTKSTISITIKNYKISKEYINDNNRLTATHPHFLSKSELKNFLNRQKFTPLHKFLLQLKIIFPKNIKNIFFLF